jgi:DNA-binding XRE family transcriptional regulator
MARPTFSQFRKNALRKPGVKSEYTARAPVFEMKRQMIALRQAAVLTQEQMAAKLGTRRSNISRLESVHSEVSPRLSTLEDYARALGYQIEVEFEPRAR